MSITKVPIRKKDTMAMSQSGLDDKDSMLELTDKQTAVVNATANNPDAGPTEIAKIASKYLTDDTVSRSYVHAIKKKYSHLIEKQREILMNKRVEGEERTEGDPFERLDESLSENGNAWQTITERPYKGDAETDETSTEHTITIELTQHEVEHVLQGSIPEGFKKELLNRIVEQAFE